MDVIYKFPLIPLQINGIKVPSKNRILHVGFQSIQLMVWILVDTDSPEIDLEFYVAATGEDITAVAPMKYPTDASYVGTAVSPTLVWHVFHLMYTSSF